MIDLQLNNRQFNTVTEPFTTTRELEGARTWQN